MKAEKTNYDMLPYGEMTDTLIAKIYKLHQVSVSAHRRKRGFETYSYYQRRPEKLKEHRAELCQKIHQKVEQKQKEIHKLEETMIFHFRKIAQ